MKRKPDVMVAVVALFFVGLIVSGFSSAFTGSKNVGAAERVGDTHPQIVDYAASRY